MNIKRCKLQSFLVFSSPALLCLILVSAFMPLTANGQHVDQQIGLEEFEKLHQELQPDPAQLWRTIPWKISVLDAQASAAESQKPIFIWAMDGHPLGCT